MVATGKTPRKRFKVQDKSPESANAKAGKKIGLSKHFKAKPDQSRMKLHRQPKEFDSSFKSSDSDSTAENMRDVGGEKESDIEGAQPHVTVKANGETRSVTEKLKFLAEEECSNVHQVKISTNKKKAKKPKVQSNMTSSVDAPGKPKFNKPKVLDGSAKLVLPDVTAQYAESERMTRFDGYWVRPSALPRLQRRKAELCASAELSEQARQRAMKKLKRAEHRYLISDLVKRAATQTGMDDMAAPSSSSADTVESSQNCDDGSRPVGVTVETVEQHNRGASSSEQTRPSSDVQQRPSSDVQQRPSGAEERMVKFDGIWMPADAVGRLKQLRCQLRERHLSEQLQRQMMKAARRREETQHKRRISRACLLCRGQGHEMADCPSAPTVDASGMPTAPVAGLCFRCGSTEHRLAECRVAGSALPFASCFVCGRGGHLARDCEQNPRGAFPRGGACRQCGQRSHLARECPDAADQPAVDGARSVRLKLVDDGAGVEDDYEQDFTMEAGEDDQPPAVVQRKHRQAKTVLF